MTPFTIVDFLVARIREEEAAARAVIPNEQWQQSFTARDLAAKRRIINMYTGLIEDDEGNLSGIGGYGEAYIEALQYLAGIYVDHPDFDEVWRT